MIKQMDLFGGGTAKYPNGPGHRGVPTSAAAAEAIKPAMSAQQAKIADYLATCAAGATYTQIADGTGIAVPSICGRMRELVACGRVAIAEETRATPSGRQARIYRIA
jgi:hypothetical protein